MAPKARRNTFILSLLSPLICLFISSPATLSAHPHVFLHTAAHFVFDHKGLSGIELRWVFDEMFSSMIFMDFDRNGDGQLDAAEIETIRKEAFSNLREFNYFTHVKIDNKRFDVKYVTEFSAESIKNKLVYRFFIPCHVTAAETFKTLKLSIFDDTFYTSIFLVKRAVTIENQASYDIERDIRPNPAEAYYFGQIVPDEIALRFKRKQ